MTLALAAGASFEEAARLANYAGGLVVMKRGTATVSRASCATPCDRGRRHRAGRDGRRRHWRERRVARRVDDSCVEPLVARGDRAAGRTIAFANGCFDLLHVGHVRYLQAAAARSRSPGRRDQRRSIGARR